MAKNWNVNFSISSSNEYSGLISFRIDWFDLLAVLGILKSLQHKSEWLSLFFEIRMKTDFSSPVVTAEFSKFASILSAALYQHHLLGFEIAQLEFHHLD